GGVVRERLDRRLGRLGRLLVGQQVVGAREAAHAQGGGQGQGTDQLLHRRASAVRVGREREREGSGGRLPHLPPCSLTLPTRRVGNGVVTPSAGLPGAKGSSKTGARVQSPPKGAKGCQRVP